MSQDTRPYPLLLAGVGGLRVGGGGGVRHVKGVPCLWEGGGGGVRLVGVIERVG